MNKEQALAQFQECDSLIFDLTMGCNSYDANGNHVKRSVPKEYYKKRKEAYEKCLDHKIENLGEIDFVDNRHMYDVRFTKKGDTLKVDLRTLKKGLRGFIDCPYDFDYSDCQPVYFKSLEDGVYLGVVRWHYSYGDIEYDCIRLERVGK